MRTLDYMIEVMTAARDGKKIEQRWNGDQSWFVPPTNISWNWTHSEYRIAPEPRKPREWIVIDEKAIEVTDKNFTLGPIAIHVREVIE